MTCKNLTATHKNEDYEVCIVVFQEESQYNYSQQIITHCESGNFSKLFLCYNKCSTFKKIYFQVVSMIHSLYTVIC